MNNGQTSVCGFITRTNGILFPCGFVSMGTCCRANNTKIVNAHYS